MKNRKPAMPFSPHETRSLVMPIVVTSILLLIGMIIEASNLSPDVNIDLIVYRTLGIIYVLFTDALFVRFIVFRSSYGFINAIFSGIGISLLFIILPEHLREVRHILIVLSGISITVMSGRRYAYLSLVCILAISLTVHFSSFTNTEIILDYAAPFVVSIVVVEVISQIKRTTQQHIQRLETINDVSRQITQSLDPKEILELLDEVIRDTLVADTHFIGFLDGSNIRFDLFHDDGEYFNGTSAPIKGTLSGWVLTNQKQMFLPDLREDIQIDGVDLLVAGKQKTSLSWIGVPLKAENVTGILALASYTANSFDRADMELLISLGQHVTLALDNAIRHEQVEKQAQLDSMTGVYNHGYFLKILADQTEVSSKSGTPLSLIMMDIDHFKQYNDTFGHLVGDRILQALCSAIKQHIKHDDAVGRWGGEEFIISLPNATGNQALQIAKRIGETMKGLHVEDRNHKTVPIPTVSQGIAVYPHEADEIYRLIDAADKRLYIAKERGRDQVEPEKDIWQA